MQFLEGKDFLVGEVEASKVGGWCSIRKVGRPRAGYFWSSCSGSMLLYIY